MLCSLFIKQNTNENKYYVIKYILPIYNVFFFFCEFNISNFFSINMFITNAYMYYIESVPFCSSLHCLT